MQVFSFIDLKRRWATPKDGCPSQAPNHPSLKWMRECVETAPACIAKEDRGKRAQFTQSGRTVKRLCLPSLDFRHRRSTSYSFRSFCPVSRYQSMSRITLLSKAGEVLQGILSRFPTAIRFGPCPLGPTSDGREGGMFYGNHADCMLTRYITIQHGLSSRIKRQLYICRNHANLTKSYTN